VVVVITVVFVLPPNELVLWTMLVLVLALAAYWRLSAGAASSARPLEERDVVLEERRQREADGAGTSRTSRLFQRSTVAATMATANTIHAPGVVSDARPSRRSRRRSARPTRR